MTPASSQANKSKSNQVFNLRVSHSQQSLIDTAAQALGLSRTAFILEAACRAAETALLDRRLFLLNASQWQDFDSILDAPVSPPAGLTELLATPAPWESQSSESGRS